MPRPSRRFAALSAAALTALSSFTTHRAAAADFIWWSAGARPNLDWGNVSNWGGSFAFSDSYAYDDNLYLFQSGIPDSYDPVVTASRGASGLWFDKSSHTISASPGATLTLGAVYYSFYENFSILANNGATANFTAPVAAGLNYLNVQSRDTSHVTFSGGLSGAGSLNITGNGAVSINSTANWNGSLNVTGGGLLNLSAVQNITGPYNISSGTVAVTSATALNSVDINLGSTSGGSGALNLSAATPTTISNNINAYGTFDPWGPNAYIGGGTIRNNGAPVTLTGPIQIGTPGVAGQLFIAGTGQTTIAGTISTSSGATSTYTRSRIVKTDSGTLTITGNNDATYGVPGPGSDGTNNFGDLRIEGGTVELRNGHAIGDSAMISVGQAGTLDLGGHNETIGSLNNPAYNLPGGAVTLGSATLTLTGTPMSTVNFSGVISGTGGVVVTGSAYQTFSGANTYSGGTTLTNGTLLAGINTPKTGPGAFGDDGLTYITVGNANTTTGAFVGINGYNIEVAKDIVFSAGPARTRGLVGAIGTFSGDIALAGSDVLVNPLYNDYSFQEGLTLSGNITGAGGLVVDSQSLGSVFLTGNAASTSAGRNITVIGGNLVLTQNTPAGPTPIVVGTSESEFRTPSVYSRGNVNIARDITVGSDSVTIGGVGDTNATFSGAITLDSHPVTLFSETDGNRAVTFSGNIGGTGYLAKYGTGTVVLSGNNTFSATLGGGTGGLRIDEGTVRFTSDAALGAAPAANFPAYILLAGGTLAPTQSLTLNSNRGIRVASSTDGNLQVDAGVTMSYSGAISRSNNSSRFVRLGDGTLSLNNATVTVNFLNSAGTTNFTGGTLAGNFTGAGGTTNFSSTPITGNATVTGGATNFIGSSLTGNFSASGGITTFDSASSYSGTMILSGGITRLSSATKLSTGRLAISGTGILETNGSINRALGTGNSQLAWTAGGFSAVGGDLSINIGGAGALQVWGTTTNFLGNSSSMILGSANATHTVTVANNIQLTTTSANATRTIQVDRGTGTAPEAILSGVLSDISTRTGSLLKTGAGALVLSGANTFRGTTTVRNGSLFIGTNDTTGSAGALGSSASAVTIGDASTTTANNLAFGVYGADASSNRAITVANRGASTTLGVFSANNATFSGNVTLSKTPNLTAPAGGTATFSGVLSSTGGITKTGDGAVLLSNTANTFTGKTTISAGTLSVASLANAGTNSSLGAATGGNATIDLGAATLKYTGANASSTNRPINLTASGATIDASGAGELTLAATGNAISGTNRNLTLAGSSSGSVTNSISLGTGSLTKSGTGTWALNGANSYSGNTNVNAGTLKLGANGTLGTTPKITVASEATLDVSDKGAGGLALNAVQMLLGSGTVMGNLAADGNVSGSLTVTGSLTGSGSVNPGNSPGIMTVGSVNPAGGLDFSFEYTQTGSPDYTSAAASGNDVLRVTDATPFTSALTAANVIDLYLPTLTDGDVYRGGFFAGANFSAALAAAAIQFFTLDPTGAITYNGQNYSPVNTSLWSLSFTTVADTAFFNGVTPTAGFVTQISVDTAGATAVPLPGAAAMGLTLLPALALHRRSRRAR